MTQQILNIGTNPNDGTGDNLRSGITKVNSNFTDLYTQLQNIPPPQAIAAGMTKLVLGPQINVGTNWYPWNLLGKTPIAGQYTQLPNGVVNFPGADGSGYDANICTATSLGNGFWSGTAYGGGFYIDADIRIDTPTLSSTPGVLPFPAFWSDEINFLAQAANGTMQWPGQALNYVRFSEIDFFQWVRNNFDLYVPAGSIDWYGPIATGLSQLQSPSAGNALAKLTFPLNTFIRFGTLVVCATATTQGYTQNFINDIPVVYGTGGGITFWNRWTTTQTPPPVAGTTASSIIDVSSNAIILGTGPGNPMTVNQVRLFQGATGWIRTSHLATTTSVVPPALTHGASTYTMAVNGTNFNRVAIVMWNGSPLTTTYVGGNQLIATVPSTLVASAGSATITVQNNSFAFFTNAQTVTIT